MVKEYKGYTFYIYFDGIYKHTNGPAGPEFQEASDFFNKDLRFLAAYWNISINTWALKRDEVFLQDG